MECNLNRLTLAILPSIAAEPTLQGKGGMPHDYLPAYLPVACRARCLPTDHPEQITLAEATRAP